MRFACPNEDLGPGDLVTGSRWLAPGGVVDRHKETRGREWTLSFSLRSGHVDMAEPISGTLIPEVAVGDLLAHWTVVA
jgi:hypothetical protein